ncbi:hypothetical protein GJ496_001116 [Pomphorhynchus laevis]|nr:hypothetical protein GJ496_001116 [Pomphorhynchus laevis]
MDTSLFRTNPLTCRLRPVFRMFNAPLQTYKPSGKDLAIEMDGRPIAFCLKSLDQVQKPAPSIENEVFAIVETF